MLLTVNESVNFDWTELSVWLLLTMHVLGVLQMGHPAPHRGCYAGSIYRYARCMRMGNWGRWHSQSSSSIHPSIHEFHSSHSPAKALPTLSTYCLVIGSHQYHHFCPFLEGWGWGQGSLVLWTLNQNQKMSFLYKNKKHIYLFVEWACVYCQHV